ncbi:MAG: ferritin family protein [Planctomycetota bacterium]|nr:MAG: ferritin family protein [Planctomycetota bacterium]
MSITFNADEIFEMAVQIEKNGAKFYRQAAQNTPDEKTKKILLDLASMEDGHLETFQEMRKQLGPREKEQLVFDPDNQAAMYLKVVADGHGWEGKKDLAEDLTGQESIEDVLKAAINAEKNSVVFYVGLKDCVSARAGKDKVEAIIKEELGHVAVLNRHLAVLK